MATVDQTKDDLATQEMLAMLDAAELEMEEETKQSVAEDNAQTATEEAMNNDDMDALLDSLDDLELESTAEDSDTESLDNILAEMSEADMTEPMTELSENATDKSENRSDDIANDILDEMLDAASNEALDDVETLEDTANTKSTLKESKTSSTTTDMENEITDNLSEDDPINAASSIEESLAELETDLEPLATSTTENSEKMAVASTSETIDLQQAIDIMKEALQMNEQMQQLAAKADATAQEASKVALATAKKAQQMALATQQQIEAQFANAQAAFEEVAQAEIPISADQIESLNEASDMDDLYNELQQKNQMLADANKDIASRLATLQKS